MGMVYSLLFLFQLMLPGVKATFSWTLTPQTPAELVLRSNASLAWKYDLGNETLRLVTFSRYDNSRGLRTIAHVTPAGEVRVYAEFKGLVSVVDQSELVIHSVRPEDESMFCCEVHFTATSANNCVLTTVLVPPTITFAPTNTTVTEGSPAVLPCNATGIPNPVIDWVGPRGQNLSPGSTFPFPNITRNDAGLYNCRARNKVGVVISQAYIDVLYFSPGTITPTGNITANQTDVVKLACHVNANPTPAIAWIKDGDVTNVLANQSRLDVVVEGKQTEGKYECYSLNLIGQGVAETNLIVKNFQPYSTSIETCPIHHVIEERDQFVMQCSAHAHPSPLFSIYHNGKLIKKNRSGYHRVCRVRREDAGNYTCVAENEFGKNTASVYLDVKYPPVAHVRPATLSVQEGASVVSLSCDATGNPSPRVQWRKSGSDAVISSQKVLVLQNLTRLDAGVYQCTASNGVKIPVTNTSSVTVIYPPSIIVPPSNKTTNESSFTSLYCEAAGDPGPQVTWYRVRNHSIWEWYITGERLVLKNVSRNDAGTYICVANSTLGNATATSTLQVQYKPSNTVLLRSGDVILTRSASLRCSTEAYPPVTWYKIYFHGQLQEVNDNGVYYIRKVTKAHEGVYHCEVSNLIGSDTSDLLFVDVKARPQITHKPQHQRLREGEVLALVCNSTGYPQPNITWLNLNRSKEVLSYGSPLVVQEVTRTDAGVYVCVAENGVGEDEKAFATVKVTYKPAIVSRTTVFLSKVGKAAKLTCQADGYPLPQITWNPSPPMGNTSYDVIGRTTVRATLIFVPRNATDFGKYKCSARNENGNSTAIMQLRDKERYNQQQRQPNRFPPFIILAMVTMGIIVGAFAMATVVMWRKSRTGKCTITSTK
ncbi:hemicentin-2 [Nematostella vectensis]|uniref:hemicentin-2 n=1 Tax=Nematostella vectensis TaxID=45351 RepID=UPI0020776BD4|nr:hemicentin-2 [Nematostella vectensis]